MNDYRADGDERVYELIRGAPTCIITRKDKECIDLDSSAHSSDEDFDMANLAQPEKFQTWKRINDEEKTRQALALYPERPCRKSDSCCKFDGSRRQWLDGNEEAGKVME